MDDEDDEEGREQPSSARGIPLLTGKTRQESLQAQQAQDKAIQETSVKATSRFAMEDDEDEEEVEERKEADAESGPETREGFEERFDDRVVEVSA